MVNVHQSVVEQWAIKQAMLHKEAFSEIFHAFSEIDPSFRKLAFLFSESDIRTANVKSEVKKAVQQMKVWANRETSILKGSGDVAKKGVDVLLKKVKDGHLNERQMIGHHMKDVKKLGGLLGIPDLDRRIKRLGGQPRKAFRVVKYLSTYQFEKMAKELGTKIDPSKSTLAQSHKVAFGVHDGGVWLISKFLILVLEVIQYPEQYTWLISTVVVIFSLVNYTYGREWIKKHDSLWIKALKYPIIFLVALVLSPISAIVHIFLILTTFLGTILITDGDDSPMFLT